MLSFLSFLTESENKIAYHYERNPEHKEFYDSFLSDNRNVRSKYLDWVSRSLKNSPLTNASTLGNAVDYFHKNKQKPSFTENKDINKYSPDQFVKKMEEHKNNQPISDSESRYDHPESDILYNNNGVKITRFNTKESTIGTRKYFDNSWCTANPNLDRNHFDDYDKGSLHMIEYRNPYSGKIQRYHTGIMDGEFELANEPNNHLKAHELPKKLTSILYDHGPPGAKGNVEFANDDQLQDMFKKSNGEINPRNQKSLIQMGHGKKMIEMLGPNISRLASSVIVNRHHELVGDLLKHAGSSIDPRHIGKIAEYPQHHDTLFKLFGDNLHPLAQQTIAGYPKSEQKLKEVMGDKLDPRAERIMTTRNEMPSFKL